MPSAKSQPSAPTQNGDYLTNHDPESEEYQKMLQRPAAVKEDMRAMEQRRRVSLVLKSQGFRSELEDIVKQLSSGQNTNNQAAMTALAQLSELFAANGQLGPSAFASLFSRQGAQPETNDAASAAQTGVPSLLRNNLNLSGLCSLIPINDLKTSGILNESTASGGGAMPKAERTLRCKLASLYRLMDLFGWTHSIYNHITARAAGDEPHFFINPFGLLYNEVTASSLVKVDAHGEVIDAGTTTLGINRAGYVLHSAIHQARPDIKCVIHLHHQAVVAVSAMKCGLLPISQEAAILGDISYHDFQGILTNDEEKRDLVKNLGPRNKILVLRHHGVAVCGESVEEAFFLTMNLIPACETQLKAAPLGVDNLLTMSDEAKSRAHKTASENGAGGVNQSKDDAPWRVGELEFTALMRQLDNAGYRTGYLYRDALLTRTKNDPNQAQASVSASRHPDVEVPPAASSLQAYMFDEDAYQTFSPAKHSMSATRAAPGTTYLNTPNTYEKVQFDEVGGLKRITKWVAPGDTPTHIPHGVQLMYQPAGSQSLTQQQAAQLVEAATATAASPKHFTLPGQMIKIQNPNQFAPISIDPKELRSKHRELKKDYYTDKTSCGPQSKVLDAPGEEQASPGGGAATVDSSVLLGAASKGIIQRDFQHNATIYKSYFAPNPFDKMTDDELAAYHREIQAKSRGEYVEAVESSGMSSPEPRSPTNGVVHAQAQSTPQNVVVGTVRTAPPRERLIVEQTHIEQPLSSPDSASGQRKDEKKKRKDKKKGFPNFPSFSGKKSSRGKDTPV